MANNKVVLGNETLIDLSSDTVAADKLLSGYTAHDKSGAAITGTLVPAAAQSGFQSFSATGNTNGNGAVVLSNIQGNPENCILIGVRTSSSSNNVTRVWKIGTDTTLQYNGFCYRANNTNQDVSSAGTVTMTKTGTDLKIFWSGETNSRKLGGNVQWVVW